MILLMVAWTAPGSALAAPAPPQQNGNGTVSGRASRWETRRIEKKSEEAAGGQSSPFALIGRLFSPQALHGYYREPGDDGFGVVLGGRESGHGIQAGIRYTLLSIGKPFASATTPNRVDLQFRGVASPYGYRAARGELRVANLFGSRFAMRLAGAHERWLNEDFYGPGPDSSPASSIEYRLLLSRVGADLTWHGPAGLQIGAGADFLDYDHRAPGEGEEGSAGSATSPVRGFADTSRFLRERVFVRFDHRDAPRDPRAGGYASVVLAKYDDLDLGVHDFRSVVVEGGHYFPFLNDLRVIAVRGLVELTSVDEDRVVPFYLRPALGGPDDMRAFPYLRFRGANRLLLQTEYRWEAWRGLEMALFFDTGQVFDEAAQIGFDRLRTAYGLGLRFKVQETRLVRIDFAHGNEGFRTHVSLNRIF